MILTKTEIEKIGTEIDRMVAFLGEHGCDTVCLLATVRTEGNGTEAVGSFSGNHYARIAVMEEYVESLKTQKDFPEGFYMGEDEDDDQECE